MEELRLRIETRDRITIRDATAFLSSIATMRDAVAFLTEPRATDVTDVFFNPRTVGNLEYLPGDFQPREWTRTLGEFGRDLERGNVDRTIDPYLLGRARAFTAMMETVVPRDPARELHIISLRIGSLETVIEELFDTLAERLRRVFRAAATLVPGRPREEYYAMIRGLGRQPLSPLNREREYLGSGMLGLASLSLEETLRSVEAEDLDVG